MCTDTRWTGAEGLAQGPLALRSGRHQGEQPLGIDHRGRHHRLEPRFGQADIAPLAQAMAPHQLRDLAFHFGPWAQAVASRPALLRRPLRGSRLLQDVFMVV